MYSPTIVTEHIEIIMLQIIYISYIHIYILI